MSGPASIVLSALLMTGAAIPAQVTPDREEPLSVGPFRSELIGTDTVGHRRAGLLCAPAGALRWRDVEPVGAKASAAAARAIHDAGVAIDTRDADDWLDHRAPTTGYRLIGDVVGLEAAMCDPGYGIGRLPGHGHGQGHGQRLKGEGRMRIAWRVYRLADHQVIASAETCAAFRFDRTGMDLSDIGQLGIIENARTIGLALARSARPFEIPTNLIPQDEACPPRVEAHRTPDGAADGP